MRFLLSDDTMTMRRVSSSYNTKDLEVVVSGLIIWGARKVSLEFALNVNSRDLLSAKMKYNP